MWNPSLVYAEELEDLAFLEQQESLAPRLRSLMTVSCQRDAVLLGGMLTLDLGQEI